MSPSTYLSLIWHELRGGRARATIFAVCVAIGVAAVTLVAGLAQGLDRGIRKEAKQLLAADIAVEGGQPVPEVARQKLQAVPGARLGEVVELLTVLAVPPADAGAPGARSRTQLVELKAIDDTYPFYGELELDGVEAGELASEIGAGGIVLAQDLLPRLGLALGDTVHLGGVPFAVRASLLAEPDRIAGAFTLGPRVLVSLAGLERAQLTGFGSQVEYRVLARLPPTVDAAALERLEEDIRGVLPEGRRFRVQTYTEAQPALRRGIERLASYLGLIALLSLLVGGIGIGQTMRGWIQQRLGDIAILKCLGMRPRQALRLYAAQALVLGLLGSAMGLIAGVGLLSVVPKLLEGIVPAQILDPLHPGPLARGGLLGLAVTLCFALPPVTRVLRVAPARVLRQDAEPLAGARFLELASSVALIIGIGGMAITQSGSARIGILFTASVLAAIALLSLVAELLSRQARRLKKLDLRPWIRQAAASLARPGQSVTTSTVALGLGLLVLFATALVERHLRDQISSELPSQAPSLFLIDIGEEQWPPLDELLRQEGATEVQSVPVIMARIAAIDGRSSEELRADAERGSRRWALTREQRLTTMETLPSDNVVTAGQLWRKPGVAEMSVEEEFASDLGVRLGSTISFDVLGVPVEFEVTSLRQVDWGTFGINFFLIAEPGSLDGAPRTRFATAAMPEGREQSAQDAVVSRFPNITVVQIGQVLAKVLTLLARLSLGIRVLALFVIGSGAAILAGTVALQSQARGAEVALFKTLGMTRGAVARLFAAEYALIGLIAASIGALGGGLLAWLAVTQAFEIEWRLYPGIFAALITLGTLLAVVVGVAASWPALRRRPIDVLRHLE